VWAWKRVRAKRATLRSAVASVFGRKFLGYAFWASPQGIKRAVAVKARKQFKQRIRELTRA
jgi:RNA-directed DNA polymerase